MYSPPAGTATPGSPKSPKAVAQQPDTRSPELDDFVSPRQVCVSASSSCVLLFLQKTGPERLLLCRILRRGSRVHLKIQLVMVNICQLLVSFNTALCWQAPQKMYSTHSPSLLTETTVLTKRCQLTCPQPCSKLLLNTLTHSAGLVKLCRLHRSTLCQSSVQQRQQRSSACS